MEIHPQHKTDLLRLLKSCCKIIQEEYGEPDFAEDLRNFAIKLERYELNPDRLALIRLAFNIMAEAEYIKLNNVREPKKRRINKLTSEISELIRIASASSLIVGYRNKSRLL